MSQSKIIKPQEGFQMDFLRTSADIAVGGGSAGAGKTFALLIESSRNIGVKNYGGVIFRRTYTQVKSQGGLWDTSRDLYRMLRGKPFESSHEWRFPYDSKIKFSHMEYEKNAEDWQG